MLWRFSFATQLAVELITAGSRETRDSGVGTRESGVGITGRVWILQLKRAHRCRRMRMHGRTMISEVQITAQFLFRTNEATQL
jgi:hypothetical protein